MSRETFALPERGNAILSVMPSAPDDPRRPLDSDRELLREQEVARLLARASELDAVRGAGTQIAELRITAAEAGISASAFDAALAEMRAQSTPPATAATASPRRSKRRAFIGAVLAVVLALGTAIVTSRLVPTPLPATTGSLVQEAILLNCLTAPEGAELVRPLLSDEASTIVHNPAAPRVLTVKTTPEQMGRVKSLLQERDGSTGACAVRPSLPQ